MKYIIIFVILLFSGTTSHAAHITGGEMIYDYLGPGSPGSKRYRITLRLFRDENCMNCADMPVRVTIGIFNNDNGELVGGYRNVNQSSTQILPMSGIPSCITNPPNLNYRVAFYSIEVELADNNAGYAATYQTCCRIDGIVNVPNMMGATYTTTIPGTNRIPSNQEDSSPRFNIGISVVCFNRPFTLDFSVTDPDPGDSLVYSFCSGYNGGAASDASFATPDPPPYGPVGYINGFSGSSPLGPQATINSATGIISGIAPNAGRYVISVCVDVFRNRSYIGTHRKDFIITVAPCDLAGVQLDPEYITCDGFSMTFENQNNSPLNETYFWDFGVQGILSDTSREERPTFVYPDTGIFTIKLIINKGLSCPDSATAIVKVYPGYFPGLTNNSPMCVGIPVQFRDLTTARYGTVNKWKWDFGIAGTSNDTSNLKNPTFIYNTVGSYTITLFVQSDKGCFATVTDTVTIVDQPEFLITNDTLICIIDTLRLNASANTAGSISWTPNYMINNTSSFNPLVSPDVTTTYTAEFRDNFGCTATKSVVVNVVDRVTLITGPDSTVCATDPTPLNVISDALQFEWTPEATLNDPTIKNPLATPLIPTTYRVTGRIGKCNATADIRLTPIPYPIVQASADTAICFGTSVTLSASGGSIYNWSPPAFLNTTTQPSVTVNTPTTDILYIVAVRDTFGCPKPVFDSIRIGVIRVIADAGPEDTAVVIGQPLQLTATGASIYNWQPPTFLNNPSIATPVSNPTQDIVYFVNVRNEIGCEDSDTISVKVFNLEPGLYVPSAFSPDGDGLNDNFKPIPIGMRSVDAFKVYNRWGQLVYNSTNMEQGWDGRLKGNSQEAGTYVWFAEGISYQGVKIEKKGSVILIR